MVTMSQKEFQRVKVIENAVGGRLSVREASRLLQLSERQVQRLKRRYQPDSVGWVQSRTLHALGFVLFPAAVDLAPGPRQVPGLQRFPSLRKTQPRGEPRRQPRDRAPPLARCQTGLSAEAPASPIPLSPPAPPALRHDGAHRCQPS